MLVGLGDEVFFFEFFDDVLGGGAVSLDGIKEFPAWEGAFKKKDDDVGLGDGDFVFDGMSC